MFDDLSLPARVPRFNTTPNTLSAKLEMPSPAPSHQTLTYERSQKKQLQQHLCNYVHMSSNNEKSNDVAHLRRIIKDHQKINSYSRYVTQGDHGLISLVTMTTGTSRWLLVYLPWHGLSGQTAALLGSDICSWASFTRSA